MADANQNFDPFKPPMPRIPGLPERRTDDGIAPDVPEARSRVRLWITWGSLGVLALGAGIAWWILGPSPSTPSVPTTREGTTASADMSPLAPIPVPPHGPVEVATAEELAKPWSYKQFSFPKRLTNEIVPAMLVRLPGGRGKLAQSYWAFSLQAPFDQCQLEFVSDPAKLASDYGYRARHPMVVNPCNLTVYHPLRYATVAGAWVRGQVVQGPGIRPPFAIEVRVEGNRILATQIE